MKIKRCTAGITVMCIMLCIVYLTTHQVVWEPEYCHLLYPPTTVDIRKEIWQAQRVIPGGNDEVVFAMHAYYDDRVDRFHRDHFIRLFVVMDSLSHERLIQSPFCYLWMKKTSHPIVVKADHITKDIKHFTPVVYGVMYHNVILSCPVFNALQYQISHVSFTAEKCANTTVYIPVTYFEKKDKFEHKFGQCNSNGISFGYMGDDQARWMIEWMEANMMFGITDFNLYNGTMQVSSKYQRVLDYYQRKGVLHLYHQPPPVVHYDRGSRNSAEIAVRTGFNDCMYRNMYRYEYLVSVDLDEIILPADKYVNYGELIGDLKRPFKKYASVSFPAMAYFKSLFGEPTNKTRSDTGLVTSKFTKYVPDHRRKGFLNPRHCMVGFGHHCVQEMNGFGRTTEIGESFAEVHHYRDKCFKEGESSTQYCKEVPNFEKVNARMQKYTSHLQAKVDRISKVLQL